MCSNADRLATHQHVGGSLPSILTLLIFNSTNEQSAMKIKSKYSRNDNDFILHLFYLFLHAITVCMLRRSHCPLQTDEL